MKRELNKSNCYILQNSHKSLKKGIAEQIFAKDLSASALTEKITLLLSDQKYKKNIAAASKVFRDQKETPLERGLWWIDYAMRNPDAAHFKSSANDLSFFEIHSMDVIAFLTIIVAAFTYGTFAILRKILKLILCRSNNANTKTKFD